MPTLTNINSKLFWLIAGSVIFLFGCSASEKIDENEKKKVDETYIFDEVPDSEVLKFESPEEIENVICQIQIGAFSTKERAEGFAERSRNYLKKDVRVSFDGKVNLYVVRLAQEFNSRTDAEKIRNELWTYEDYVDAWIVIIKNRK